RSAEPLDIALPSLVGVAIVGSRDFTEVSVSGAGGPVRTMSRSLELRAARAGALEIGPVTVRQGARTVRTDPITITVDSAAGSANVRGPIARSLLGAAPRPPPGRLVGVVVAVVVPVASRTVGQQ